MNQRLSIILYGSILILAGVFLLISTFLSFDTLRLVLGICLTLGAIFSFISAFGSRKNKASFAYHEIHALAFLGYSVSSFLFSDSLETLIPITAFLFIFYSFSEIIFCLRLYDLQSKILIKIVIIRSVLALAVGIGTIVALNFSEYTLEGFGILFIIVGINIALYVPIIKAKEFTDG